MSELRAAGRAPQPALLGGLHGSSGRVRSVVPRSFSVLSSSGTPPGVVYNEAMLQGLDYVVDQARQHNLRVLLVLTDYFRDDAGGPLQYMR